MVGRSQLQTPCGHGPTIDHSKPVGSELRSLEKSIPFVRQGLTCPNDSFARLIGSVARHTYPVSSSVSSRSSSPAPRSFISSSADDCVLYKTWIEPVS